MGNAFRPRLLFYQTLARLIPDFSLGTLRRLLYLKAGCHIGERVVLMGRIKMVGAGNLPNRLWIGAGSLIAPGVTFGLDDNITIGRQVSIGPNALLYTATHALGFGSCRMVPAVITRPIKVEDGVWIGMNSLILPGIILGHGCVVSAGSVVAADVAPNTLVSGNPAVVVQNLPFGDR